MPENQQWLKDLYFGLQILANLSFPKSCDDCGQIFETADHFRAKTEGKIRKSRILKHLSDDKGKFEVQLFNDCVCGSILKDYFTNCHEYSEIRLRRRRKFENVLDRLVHAGLEKATARIELLKILRGEKSRILEGITAS